jgi:hypothetical protein
MREIARQGEATATRLEADLRVPRQNFARAVKDLLEAGLIAAERRGRETWYSARSEAARAAAHWMLEFADGLAPAAGSATGSGHCASGCFQATAPPSSRGARRPGSTDMVDLIGAGGGAPPPRLRS